MSILYTVLLLGIIIFVHEFGHFIVAKKNGIHVVEFSIGFGPNIVSKVHKGTRYSLKWIPFGGACQMLGDDMGLADSEVDALPKELEDYANKTFQSKPVLVRMAVLFAGPFFNFILAFIFSVIVLNASGIDLPKIKSLLDDYPAQQAGLQPGDLIISYNGHKMHTQRDITLYMSEDYKGGSIHVVYERNGERGSCDLVPKYSEEDKRLLVGYQFAPYEKATPLQLLKYSANEVVFWIKLTIRSIGMLFNGKASVNDLSGPVGIAGVVNDTVQETKPYGFYYVIINLLNLGILFSANLGVMNLLPIPALDGGRLLFLLIELVRGKPVAKEKEAYVTIAGMLLLFGLMIFVLFNDIGKVFFK